MFSSKVTQKGQTTLPGAVRLRLKIQPGDHIVYEDTEGGFLIRRAQPFDLAWHAAVQKTLSEEWNSPEDAEAFSDM